MFALKPPFFAEFFLCFFEFFKKKLFYCFIVLLFYRGRESRLYQGISDQYMDVWSPIYGRLVTNIWTFNLLTINKQVNNMSVYC